MAPAGAHRKGFSAAALAGPVSWAVGAAGDRADGALSVALYVAAAGMVVSAGLVGCASWWHIVGILGWIPCAVTYDLITRSDYAPNDDWIPITAILPVLLLFGAALMAAGIAIGRAARSRTSLTL